MMSLGRALGVRIKRELGHHKHKGRDCGEGHEGSGGVGDQGRVGGVGCPAPPRPHPLPLIGCTWPWLPWQRGVGAWRNQGLSPHPTFHPPPHSAGDTEAPVPTPPL